MNVEVTQTWMTHSSGSKYYQVFELRPEGGVPVTLVHYGGVKDRTRAFSRPVNGGQTAMHSGAVGRSKISAKDGRGYDVDDHRQHRLERDDTWWRAVFGADLAHKLDVAMFGHLEGADTGPTDDPDNEVIAEKTAPVIEARPESWGAW